MATNITRDAISALAYKISAEHKTYDQFCWQLAEIELKLERGSKPEGSAIRALAQSIFDQHMELSLLHWLIAERSLLLKQKFPALK
jgi:hypothetical protein